jgi:hypothetical protein
MLDVAELQLGNAEVDNCSLQGPNLTMPTVQFATMTPPFGFQCKTFNFFLIAIVIRQDDSLTNDSSSQLQSIDTIANQWDGSLSIATIPQSTAVQQSNISNGTVCYYDFCPSALNVKLLILILTTIVIRQDDSLTNDSSSQLQPIDTTAHQWDGSLSIATIPQSTAVQQWCEPC